jgi:hypothetical protein
MKFVLLVVLGRLSVSLYPTICYLWSYCRSKKELAPITATRGTIAAVSVAFVVIALLCSVSVKYHALPA